MAGFAVLLCIIMWVAMVSGYLALTALLRLHKFEEISSSTWYICVLIVLELPHWFNIAHCIWSTSFICIKKWTKWPTPTHIFTGIIASLLEVACLSVLLIEFAPIFPDHVLLLLSGSIYSVPVMNEYIKERRQRRDLKHGEDEYNYNGGDNISTSANQRQGNKLSLKPAVFCLSSSMPLIIAGILYTWSPYKLHILHVFLLPVIILLLSILWTPEIQLDFYRSSDRRMDSRQKTSFMYAIVKIVAIPLCISVVLLTRFKDLRSLYFFDFIRYGFEQLLHFRIYIHVIVISFAGLLTIFTGILCAKMRLTTTGMLLPSMMSIPTVIGLNIMLCLSTEGGYCYDPSFWFISSTILAAIVWFLPLLLYGSIFTRPSDILLKPFQEIFLQFTWTPFFTDQYLILNYHSDGFGSKLCEVSGDLEVAKSKSKVFICTTMFNEKEIEMKRLLLSLNNLAKSSRLQHVYLEAHIFMDNGSRDNILNKNSLILLSLIKCLDGVKVNSLKQYLTPYGIQMSWTLRNDFQLFVHFKDCLKFKAKKRWSQVMYMNYILNYRCKVAKNESYRREYSYEKCLTNMKFSSYQHIPYGGISQPNDTCVKLHKEYENYSGKHIRNKKRQQPNHSSILKMELRKLRNLLKVGNEEVYENIEACLSKNKIRSSGIDHSKLPIIQTISNVIDLLNKRLHPRYMTTNYELPFQITAEESSSEESGIQSIPYTISENELEFSRGFTPGEDILDASENEAESTDVSSLYDDQIVTSDETLNKHAERTSPGSDTPLADNRTQDLSSDDQNSSSVDKNVSFPIISPLIACPGKSASASCVNLPNPICKYSFDLTPKHIRTEKPFQKGYVQYDVKTMNRKTKQSENKRSYQTTSSTTSPSSSSINTISSNIASDILQGNNYDEYTYILATDADMEFDDKSLSRLIDLCNRDKNVGGACGRTSPVGHINTPVVWYQKFEYAKDFWMIKSSQNVIGCVMCCPGCFSLYRAAAIKDIMHTYSEPIQSEFDVFVKDHGEDRWLCTLMMLNGWKLEYSSYSNNSTFCPDTFLEFLKQRKRWVLSEMSNLILVFGNMHSLTQNNSSFSLIYIFYILQMFLLVVLSPGTTIIVLTASLDILFGLSCVYTTPVCLVALTAYTAICSTMSTHTQSDVTSTITALLGAIVLSIGVAYVRFFVTDTLKDLDDGQLEFKQYYLILLLVTAVLYAAIIHPREAWTLIHGLTFLVVFPAMYILLPFYAVSNIVDQRWGTRESDPESPSCYRFLYDKLLSRDKGANTVQDVPETLQDNGEEGRTAANILPETEHHFWEELRVTILGTDVNLGANQATLKLRLRIMRNRLAGILLVCNTIWVCLLTGLYLTIPKHDTIFGIITCSIYSFSLVIQLIGLTAHKCDSFFREFVIKTFGRRHPIWIYETD